MSLFRTISILCLVALGFLVGAFVTQWNDKLINIGDIAKGAARAHPWYWEMPLGAWIGYAVLLLVIIGVCQVAIRQNPNPASGCRCATSPSPGSDGPVK